MKKTKKITLGLIITIALIFISYFFGMRANILQNESKISSDIIKNQILSVKELTTLKYKYTNVGFFENQSEFYGLKIPFTQKKFIISYDGEVNAGVNLEDAKIDLDDKTKHITIDLPKAEILNHIIDENSLTIMDEKNSIFNQIKLDDFQQFRKDEMKKVEDSLLKKGFLEDADQESKKAIEDILKINPLLDEYKIEYKNNEVL